ncbi:unnamed protein product, partial [Phaeothamnion confervicola]
YTLCFSSTLLELPENSTSSEAVTVTLLSEPTAAVIVTLTSVTGSVSVSPSSLTFDTGNWSVSRSVTVTGVDDDYDQRGPHNDTIVATLTSVDAVLDGAGAPNMTVTLANDDTAGLLFYNSSSTAAVSAGSGKVLQVFCTEGSSTCSFSGELMSRPYDAVSVVLANSSAVDVVFSPTELSFDSGITSFSTLHSVTVAITDDNIAKVTRNHTITYVTLSDDTTYDGTMSGTIQLVIADDDSPEVIVSKTAVNCYIQTNGSSTISSTYEVKLRTQPASAVVVTVASSNSLTTVSPATLTFTATSYATEQTVTVSATAAAQNSGSTTTALRTDTVSHYATSSDTFYSGIAVGSVTAKVWVSEDTSPPPTLSSVQFTDSLAGLTLLFDKNTNRGSKTGQFACSELVNTTTTPGLGTSPMCSWSGSATMNLVFGSSPTIEPDDIVYLIDSIIKSSDYFAILYSNDQSAIVLDPDDPTSVVVSLSAPTSVSLCDSLVLDGSLTTGSGGRDLTYSWSMDDTSTTTAAARAILAATSSSTVTLGASVLESDRSFIISLTATNFLGSTSTATATVKKLSYSAPALSIDGAASVSITRADSLALKMTATLPNQTCTMVDSGVASATLAYSWSETTGLLSTTVVQGLVTSNPR